MRRYEHPRTRNEFLATIEENDDWDNTQYDKDGNAILRVGEKEEDEVFVVNPMKTHHPSKVILRSDSDPGEEFPMVVREIAMKRGGSKRHESRVKASEWALVQAYMKVDEDALSWDSDESERELLRAIAEFELHGVGGPEGFAGGATARMSWASSLGKGRRNARGGEAWDAAICGAFDSAFQDHLNLDGPGYSCTPEAALEAVGLLQDGFDPLFACCYALHRAMESSPEVSHEWVKVFKAAAAKVTDEFAPFDRVWWSFPRRGDGSDPLETMETVDYQPEECIPMASGPGPIVEILSRRGTLEGGE